MPDSVRRELRVVKVYAYVLTLAVGALSLTAFRQSSQHAKFDVIDVERINVVEPNGNLRLVISNPNGKPRLRLAVDSLGAASVEFLDANGRVTSHLPGP